jgi:hypothetical protein
MSGLWIARRRHARGENRASDRDTLGVLLRGPRGRIKPRRAEVVIVSLYDTKPNYIGLSQLGRSLATGEVTLRISNFVPVKQLDRDAVQAALPKKFSGRHEPPTIGVYRSTPHLWEKIQNVIVERTAEIDARLADLRRALRKADEGPRGRVAGGLEIFGENAHRREIVFFRQCCVTGQDSLPGGKRARDRRSDRADEGPRFHRWLSRSPPSDLQTGHRSIS